MSRSKLSAYLKKPLSDQERWLVPVLLVIYVLFSLVGVWFTYYGVDACYDGLISNIWEQYSYMCESGTIEEKFGTAFEFLNFSILLGIFNKPKWLLYVPISTLAFKFLFVFIEFVYNFYANAAGWTIGAIPLVIVALIMNLPVLGLILYLAAALIRKIKRPTN